MSDPSPDAGKAAQQAAKIAGTNRDYVQKAKKIKECDPERFEAVRRGRATIPTVNQELQEIRLRKREEKRKHMEEMRLQMDARDRAEEFGPPPLQTQKDKTPTTREATPKPNACFNGKRQA
jgi:hypothetical protein